MQQLQQLQQQQQIQQLQQQNQQLQQQNQQLQQQKQQLQQIQQQQMQQLQQNQQQQLQKLQQLQQQQFMKHQQFLQQQFMIQQSINAISSTSKLTPSKSPQLKQVGSNQNLNLQSKLQANKNVSSMPNITNTLKKPVNETNISTNVNSVAIESTSTKGVNTKESSANNIPNISIELRKIFVPEELPKKFLEIAKENTENNIETCGVLCGILKNDAYQLTTVIIPKQTASSDTCIALDEIEVLNFQQKHNLLTLGWIHTQ